jgi:hypothetical protein
LELSVAQKGTEGVEDGECEEIDEVVSKLWELKHNGMALQLKHRVTFDIFDVSYWWASNSKPSWLARRWERRKAGNALNK